MTTSEKVALTLVDELLTFALGAEVSDTKCDFSKGLAAGYRGAAQLIVGRMRSGYFSEQD